MTQLEAFNKLPEPHRTNAIIRTRNGNTSRHAFGVSGAIHDAILWRKDSTRRYWQDVSMLAYYTIDVPNAPRGIASRYIEQKIAEGFWKP